MPRITLPNPLIQEQVGVPITPRSTLPQNARGMLNDLGASQLRIDGVHLKGRIAARNALTAEMSMDWSDGNAVISGVLATIQGVTGSYPASTVRAVPLLNSHRVLFQTDSGTFDTLHGELLTESGLLLPMWLDEPQELCPSHFADPDCVYLATLEGHGHTLMRFIGVDANEPCTHLYLPLTAPELPNPDQLTHNAGELNALYGRELRAVYIPPGANLLQVRDKIAPVARMQEGHIARYHTLRESRADLPKRFCQKWMGEHFPNLDAARELLAAMSMPDDLWFIRAAWMNTFPQLFGLTYQDAWARATGHDWLRAQLHSYGLQMSSASRSAIRVVDKDTVSFYRTLEDANNDKRTTAKPGKAFKALLEGASDETVKALVSRYKGETTPPEMIIGFTKKHFDLAYTKGPSSCMTYERKRYYALANVPGDSRPTDALINGDIGVAYILAGDKVTARTLVVKSKKAYIRLYAADYATPKNNHNVLERMLRDQGYSHEAHALVGQKLKKIEIPLDTVGEETQLQGWLQGLGLMDETINQTARPRLFLCPYLDTGGWPVQERDDHLLVIGKAFDCEYYSIRHNLPTRSSFEGLREDAEGGWRVGRPYYHAGAVVTFGIHHSAEGQQPTSGEYVLYLGHDEGYRTFPTEAELRAHVEFIEGWAPDNLRGDVNAHDAPDGEVFAHIDDLIVCECDGEYYVDRIDNLDHYDLVGIDGDYYLRSNTVETLDRERIHRNDAGYSHYHDGYFREGDDDYVWVESRDDYIERGECTEINGVWYLDGDLVECHHSGDLCPEDDTFECAEDGLSYHIDHGVQVGNDLYYFRNAPRDSDEAA